MIVVCQQANYFPWLGYLEQCARAEQLIILDSVQWIKQGHQHRIKILPHFIDKKSAHIKSPDKNSPAKTPAEFQWLTLPVMSTAHREKTMGEMQLNPDDDWSKRHWHTLSAIYGKRPQFKTQFEPLLRPWFEAASLNRKSHTGNSLSDICVSSMQLCFDALDFHPKIILSSTLPTEGTKSDRIIALCKAVNADIYYSGMASASYLNASTMQDSNIQLIWQRWKHTEYDQGRTPFKSHLSFIDALANVPLDEIKSWLELKPWGPFGKLLV